MFYLTSRLASRIERKLFLFSEQTGLEIGRGRCLVNEPFQVISCEGSPFKLFLSLSAAAAQSAAQSAAAEQSCLCELCWANVCIHRHNRPPNYCHQSTTSNCVSQLTREILESSPWVLRQYDPEDIH